MDKFHGITISKGTLLNKLKEYGLRRRGNVVDRNRVRECIEQELDGSGQMLGYRAMWRRLQSKYDIQVPRLVVQTILRDIDLEGSTQRRSNRLRRRNYFFPDPNYCWHADGYDKLKPYGFPIHGCIDAFSRRILWLEIVRSKSCGGEAVFQLLKEIAILPYNSKNRQRDGKRDYCDDSMIFAQKSPRFTFGSKSTSLWVIA